MVRDLPEWAKDRIYSNVDFQFDFRDRLKILLTGSLSLRVEVTCEERPGRLESDTKHWVRWPQLWRRKPICFIAEVREVSEGES